MRGGTLHKQPTFGSLTWKGSSNGCIGKIWQPPASYVLVALLVLMSGGLEAEDTAHALAFDPHAPMTDEELLTPVNPESVMKACQYGSLPGTW